MRLQSSRHRYCRHTVGIAELRARYVAQRRPDLPPLHVCGMGAELRKALANVRAVGGLQELLREADAGVCAHWGARPHAFEMQERAGNQRRRSHSANASARWAQTRWVRRKRRQA